uniref:Ig-like domain-containing protein n=1 Tax=Stegastes partitus TaxID=144197 RepID=A0A3B4ZDS0_9TELE
MMWSSQSINDLQSISPVLHPPAVTVRTGETASMDCTALDGPRIYKQIPGGVPQFVLNFYHSFSSPKFGSGFSSPKFTVSHQSNSDYRLRINNVEERDSAVYYCATYDSSTEEWPTSTTTFKSNNNMW